MRALHPVVNSAVALLLLAVAMEPAVAQTPTEKKADAQTLASIAAEVPAQEPQTAHSSMPTETQSVHIQVGRSIILNTQSRLRRIVVSSPDVLDTAIISPTQVVVTAKSAGSSSLVLWDETSNARIVDVFADVDVSGLREDIRSAYPNETVEIEPEEGRVVVTGKVSSKAVEDDMLRIASSYSKNVVDSTTLEVRREKQVMMKVRFIEVDRTKLQQFGINILSTGASGTIGSTTTGQFAPPTLQGSTLSGVIGQSLTGANQGAFQTTSLMNIFLYRPDLNLGAMITDLEEKNIAQILSEPNLMARSGEPAKFLAGGEFPFPVVQGGTGNGTAVTIVFKPYGVKLEFTATVVGDEIRLKIAPEVSTLDFTNAVTISGFEVPALSTRRAETDVVLKNGQSFGIAGLLDRRTTIELSKVPGIGDIPILGELFKSRSVNKTNTDLLVLVTPTIVDTATEPMMAPTPTVPVPSLEEKQFDSTLGSRYTQPGKSTTNDK
ncbi:MAG: type II and III secretion system protein family protein [Candidatus Korobacteraceae bacterium]